MFVLGMDIGYSNLKLTFGESRDTGKSVVFPAGAAPDEHISRSIISGTRSGGTAVRVGDRDYVAGISQSSLDGWQRVLSSDYPRSDDYLALYYASLLATERDSVDLVVTGLPVEQCEDEKFKAEIEDRLRGKHQVTQDKTIKVHDAKVIPQPVGAFVDYLMSAEEPHIVQASRVLVVDPGFFSVDWCAIDRGNFDKSSSDSSQEAMSVLLEEAGKLVTDDYGRPYDLATLEDSVRSDMKVPANGQMVDLEPYLAWASGNVAETVMRKVRQKMRRASVQAADFTLLTGGGAKYYKEAAANVMQGSKVVTAKEPVLANSRGFFAYGQG